MFKVTVIITNYNYEKFLEAAINSVYNQTYQYFEILIIDDGSTDRSYKILTQFKEKDKIRIILKKNGGQLSCFNCALPYIKGDIVCFLDADDLYEKEYLEKIVEIYQSYRNCDFLIVNRKFIDECGNEIRNKLTDENKNKKKCECLGLSLLRTYYLKKWIGGPTSTISIKKEILLKILPLPFEQDWRVRADDCLVWGSSLVLACKHRFNLPLVKYRLHGSNYFAGKKFSLEYCYKRTINIEKMFHFILKRNKIYIPANNLSHLLLLEFQSIEKKRIEDIKDFLKILYLLKIPMIQKSKLVFSLVKSLFKNKEFKGVC